MPSASFASSTGSAPQSASTGWNFSAPWIIFWVALALRVLYVTFGHTWRIPGFEHHFKFGYEMGRIAASLATGHGYANPFNMPTGPTAWEPPLYPLLMAGVFKLLGVYSALSAWVILSLNSVFSAATAMLLYPIAARCYNRKVAIWSAWIWALYPACMQYAVRWIWEMALTCMLFTAVLALAVKMRGVGEPSKERAKPTTRQWLLFGLLWGLIALCNPALLIFLPVCGLWILLGTLSKAAVARAVASGLIFIAVIAPWTIRNYRTFHTFMPLRDNFGAELYIGDGPGSTGFRYGALIGPGKDAQYYNYMRMGEVAYCRWRGDVAKKWIRDHRARFTSFALKRVYFFWADTPHPSMKHPSRDYIRRLNFCIPSILGIFGLLLSLKRRIPAAGMLAWAFVLYPLVYYFVTVEARFRSPLEPLIVIFCVFAVQSAERSWAVLPSIFHRNRNTIA